MPECHADAVWKGSLKGGEGHFTVGSKVVEGSYSFSTRFEQAPGTNPEELIAAAHASCFSMALSKMLGDAGHQPEAIQTQARVHLEQGDGGFSIPRIDLHCEAEVPGIDQDSFLEHANKAKEGCPVSKVLNAQISLEAKLRT